MSGVLLRMPETRGVSLEQLQVARCGAFAPVRATTIR
jgi:hypothetical protein